MMQEPPKLSCCLCGAEGHCGLIDDCPRLLPEHLQAERASERSRDQQRQQHRRFEEELRYSRRPMGERGGGQHWNQHDDRMTWAVARRDDARLPRQAPLRVSVAPPPGSRGGMRGEVRARNGGRAWNGNEYGPERYGHEAHPVRYAGSELPPRLGAGYPGYVGQFQGGQGVSRSGQYQWDPQIGRRGHYPPPQQHAVHHMHGQHPQRFSGQNYQRQQVQLSQQLRRLPPDFR
jgi:hypothetical protein